MKFATKAIHAGQEPDPRTGAVNIPVYLSSTFKQDGLGGTRDGFEYARTDNPTRRALEATLAALENGTHALAFSSGCAATTAVLNLLQPGDHVVSTIDVYGGTYRLFHRVFAKYGIAFDCLATSSADEIVAATRAKTKLIWLETPTNPLLNVIDIARVADGKPKGAVLTVDNTFATPCWQTPLDLGADLVAHSMTKYLGGHSDLVAGALVTHRADLHEPLKFYQNAAGGVPGLLECYLVMRGMKTLEVRMERHQKNAFAVAEWLGRQPQVGTLYFPGLPSHPHHAVARKQMRGHAGMVSFELKGGRAELERFLAALHVFTLAESLGGVESLVCYPFSMTHGSIPAEEKNRIGITEQLVRLSCGLEDADDLVADLDHALAAARG